MFAHFIEEKRKEKKEKKKRRGRQGQIPWQRDVEVKYSESRRRNLVSVLREAFVGICKAISAATGDHKEKKIGSLLLRASACSAYTENLQG